ncbi:hypothetical protein Esti_006421 [Eimeria stiedai]
MWRRPLMRCLILPGLVSVPSPILGLRDAEEVASKQEMQESSLYSSHSWKPLKTFSIPLVNVGETTNPDEEALAGVATAAADSEEGVTSETGAELSHENLLANLVRTRGEDPEDTARRICEPLLPGLAPADLQFATIGALHIEKLNIENAIVSVEASNKLRPAPQTNVLLTQLKQRLAASNKKFEDLLENMQKCLTQLSDFSQFLETRRALQGEVTRANFQRLQKIENTLEKHHPQFSFYAPSSNYRFTHHLVQTASASSSQAFCVS